MHLTERRDDQIQLDSLLSPNASFVLCEGVLEFGVGFGGILQGVQENIPISSA